MRELKREAMRKTVAWRQEESSSAWHARERRSFFAPISCVRMLSETVTHEFAQRREHMRATYCARTFSRNCMKRSRYFWFFGSSFMASCMVRPAPRQS